MPTSAKRSPKDITSREVAVWIKAGVPKRHAVGYGLYLQIARLGDRPATASWLFRYWIPDDNVAAGKTVWVGLGSTELVTLAEAREKARAMRKLRLDNIDPLEHKRAKRTEARAAQAERHYALTFRTAATRFLGLYRGKWRSDKHARQWIGSLKENVFPTLGDEPVAGIDQALINATLAPLSKRTPVTAQRTAQRISRVLKWVADGMPPPKPDVDVVHHASLLWQQVPSFMAKLRALDTVAARALEVTILTAARSGEARGMRWSEVDLDGRTWTIPKERMKADVLHTVPLSDRVVEILGAMQREQSGPLVFPGRGGVLSDVALLRTSKRIDPGLTVHGFRSSFRTWVAEATAFPDAVAEAALAHTNKNKVEAAYKRSSLFQKRCAMMTAWADFCASPAERPAAAEAA